MRDSEYVETTNGTKGGGFTGIRNDLKALCVISLRLPAECVAP